MDTPFDMRNTGEILGTMPWDLFTHASRVELYVRSICLRIATKGSQEICTRDCLLFGRAAFFHDIGKLWIPNSILTKPGKLSPEELLIIQKHPFYANRILELLESGPIFSNNPTFFHLAVSAALFHHEWWNGLGYPLGVSGRGIPLIARITSICDAFDTITSGRHYCSPRSVDEAFSEIEKCAGLQFDPKLSAFLIQNQDVFTDLMPLSTANAEHIDYI